MLPSRHRTNHNSTLTFQLQSHQVDRSLLTSNAQRMTFHILYVFWVSVRSCSAGCRFSDGWKLIPADHFVTVVLLSKKTEGGLDHSTPQPKYGS